MSAAEADRDQHQQRPQERRDREAGDVEPARRLGDLHGRGGGQRRGQEQAGVDDVARQHRLQREHPRQQDRAGEQDRPQRPDLSRGGAQRFALIDFACEHVPAHPCSHPHPP